MKPFIQLTIGLLTAMGMVVFIFGALLLSLSEDAGFAQAMITPDAAASPTDTVPPITPPPGITLVVRSPSPSPTTAQPRSTSCQPPSGWRSYTVMAGDQLSAIAIDIGRPIQELMEANCMITPELIPGTLLYLPPPPTATLTATASLEPTITLTTTVVWPTRTPQPSCGPYRGWVLYTVQPGDNLFKLSQAFGVSVYQLQQANCLQGTLIQAGNRIYVPNIATRTPVIAPTDSPTPTLTPSRTTVPSSLTPTNTVSPSASATLTPTASSTMLPPSGTPTDAPTGTATPTPTLTLTPTVTEPSPTDTGTPTTTPTAAQTPDN
jgi:LysM repeat protein